MIENLKSYLVLFLFAAWFITILLLAGEHKELEKAKAEVLVRDSQILLQNEGYRKLQEESKKKDDERQLAVAKAKKDLLRAQKESYAIMDNQVDDNCHDAAQMALQQAQRKGID